MAGGFPFLSNVRFAAAPTMTSDRNVLMDVSYTNLDKET